MALIANRTKCVFLVSRWYRGIHNDGNDVCASFELKFDQSPTKSHTRPL